MALYATNRFAGDEVTTQYEINFVGMYLSKSHVKAYVINNATGVMYPVTILPSQWLNATTISGFAPVAIGHTLVIYRDTPKTPLVDFVDGARITESSLDTAARQGMFIAAEISDLLSLAQTSSGGGRAGVMSFNGRTGAVTAQTGDYTKEQVGLGNVDNTSDSSKPVSTAQAAAIASAVATKQDTLASGTNIKTINGSSILGSGNLTISGGGGAGGDMFKADYDSNADGKVDAADVAGVATTALTVPWGGVSGKPTEFPPSAHSHAVATTGAAGFMSAADKIKLDGVADGASGYLGVPQVSSSAAYTLVLSDAGKHILHPATDTAARTWTIPANSAVAFPIGTAVTFVNQASAGSITISITSDTMRLAGAGTTGNRTLAAGGLATAMKITATEWIISGVGLT